MHRCGQRVVALAREARAPGRSAPQSGARRQVTSRSSACSPYDTVVASLASVKRSPSRLDGADARPRVAAGADLRGHGRKQRLPLDDFVEVRVEERRPTRMARDARDLNVVHGEHHAARSAPLCDRRAHRGQLAHSRTAPAVRGWNDGGEEPRLTRRVDGLGREPRGAIDVGAVRRRGARNSRLSARHELARRRGNGICGRTNHWTCGEKNVAGASEASPQ